MATVHVYPEQDLYKHVLDGLGCACLPEVEAVPCDDGSNGWLITHNAWDRREAAEAKREASRYRRSAGGC